MLKEKICIKCNDNYSYTICPFFINSYNYILNQREDGVYNSMNDMARDIVTSKLNNIKYYFPIRNENVNVRDFIPYYEVQGKVEQTLIDAVYPYKNGIYNISGKKNAGYIIRLCCYDREWHKNLKITSFKELYVDGNPALDITLPKDLSNIKMRLNIEKSQPIILRGNNNLITNNILNQISNLSSLDLRKCNIEGNLNYFNIILNDCDVKGTIHTKDNLHTNISRLECDKIVCKEFRLRGTSSLGESKYNIKELYCDNIVTRFEYKDPINIKYLYIGSDDGFRIETGNYKVQGRFKYGWKQNYIYMNIDTLDLKCRDRFNFDLRGDHISGVITINNVLVNKDCKLTFSGGTNIITTVKNCNDKSIKEPNKKTLYLTV